MQYVRLLMMLLLQIFLSISGGLFISKRIKSQSLAGSIFTTFFIVAVLSIISGFILFSLFII